MYSTPRRSSSVIVHAHTLTPERLRQPLSSHVSWPRSPGRGTVWNVHTSLPVRTSNARVSPGSASATSPVVAPKIARSPKITGTPFHGTAICTTPSLPKPVTSAPLRASSATSVGPAVSRIRGGNAPSPGQYATPRAVVSSGAGNARRHSSRPVSAASASTSWPRTGRYMTPSTTIGVACGFPAAPGASSSAAVRATGTFHASASVPTLFRSICVSAENRVPAWSWLNIGQSPGGAAGAARAAKMTASARAEGRQLRRECMEAPAGMSPATVLQPVLRQRSRVGPGEILAAPRSRA